MLSEFLEIVAFFTTGYLFLGIGWLVIHLFERRLVRFEDSCLEALDAFLGPIREAHQAHIAANAKRIAEKRMRGDS